MNATKRSLSSQAALAACLFAFTALAQPEQWLEYHTGAEPKGYRWLELSTNAPAKVPLPKLQTGASFGCWSNALEATGGRWFCLDRSRKSGPCDRLFFDRNGNGRLDDESPVDTLRRDGNTAYFEPIKMVFKGEDGPISYHLIARFYQFDKDRAQLLVGAGGWYEGMVTLAGKKRRVQLIDNTVNGAFNDQGANPSDSDRLVIVGDKGMDRYLGRYLEVEGQLFKIEVARDGAFLKLQKAEGVALGAVRVPETICDFTAVGECGHFVRKPAKGGFTLPVGKYRVHGWTIDRKDDKGTAWKLSGYSFNKAAGFEVATGNATVLEIGEPVQAALQATESMGRVAFNLRLLGTSGESVEIMRGSERPRAPRLQVASLAGAFRSTNTFEYG